MYSSFHNRLHSARVMRGLSLQALADKLGKPYNKQLLNRLESGSQQPNGEQLHRISQVLDQPVDFFMKPLGVQIGTMEFRKTLSVGKKVTDRLREIASDYLERYLELEDLLGLEKKTAFGLQKVRLNPDDPASVQNEAKRIREQIWNVGLDPLASIIQILEGQGVKVYIVDRMDGLYLSSSFSGFSTIVNNEIGFIVINGNPDIPLVRKRFTLLHEFAHLYLDLQGIEHKKAEKLCDALAGAILVPQEALIEAFGEKRSKIHISELKLFKSKFGASLSSIVYGLSSLGIISKSFQTYWMIEYNKHYRKDEGNGYSGDESSTRFMQLLLRALSTDIISESKAAALNNQKTGDFMEYLDNFFVHENSSN